ncbi:MAG TPA: DoxX family protein [Alphaproteobacteria bacterium]|nr:DoxX family protein [Alphaproteobacteria bacterium]
MNRDGGSPKLFIPALQPFYDRVVPLAWPLVRLACGWNLIVHGWGKVTRGPSAFVATFGQLGFDPLFVWAALLIEFVGGICIALGLFTRFWAAAAAVEMGIITFGVYWPAGFSWLNRGYEYTLMWGLLALAVALRGGGPYSLDRRLGREL